jgi:hypothetical protein
MKNHGDPLSWLGSALVCALIAQALNVLLAAVVAAQMPGGYRVRSSVFLGALLWSVAGTGVLLVRTTGPGSRTDAIGVRPGRIALWLVSSWLWPILVRRRRPASQEPS